VQQLKSLFVLFTQQRKALEVSIAKGKKLEDDNGQLQQRNRNLEEQHKMFYARIEQLEHDRETLVSKHKKDKELLDQEIEDGRTLHKKLEFDLRDALNQKLALRRQVEEYELKIKRMIIEFEEQARKHIRELNDAYEQVRLHQAKTLDLEQKLAKHALHSDRLALHEAQRLKQENDQLLQRLQFVELRYQTLASQIGLAPEQQEAIDRMVLGQPPDESVDVEAVVQPRKRGSKGGAKDGIPSPSKKPNSKMEKRK